MQISLTQCSHNTQRHNWIQKKTEAVEAHAHIFALADTFRLKTVGLGGGGGGTEATEHTTKSKQTALSYELS